MINEIISVIVKRYFRLLWDYKGTFHLPFPILCHNASVYIIYEKIYKHKCITTFNANVWVETSFHESWQMWWTMDIYLNHLLYVQERGSEKNSSSYKMANAIEGWKNINYIKIASERSLVFKTIEKHETREIHSKSIDLIIFSNNL